jgi:hypothetical protein
MGKVFDAPRGSAFVPLYMIQNWYFKQAPVVGASALFALG